MPFMTNGRILRNGPNGALTEITVEPGDEVVILQEDQAWIQIRLAGSPVTGWVQKNAVADTSPVPAEALAIDESMFFRQCWLDGLSSDVFPHYLAGVAKLRSGIKNDTDTQSNEIGVFRFLQSEWNACRADAALKLTDLDARDIKDWDFQCTMFAAIAARDFNALKGVLGRPPSALELYLAQLIGPSAAGEAVKAPTATIGVDLGKVADTALPLGGLTRDQIMARYAKYLLDAGQPPPSVIGSVALDRLATDLQAALNAVKDGVIAAGLEVLGAAPNDTELVGDAKTPLSGGAAGADPAGPGPQGLTGAGGPLGRLVAAHESGRQGYQAFNRGNAGDSGRIDFSIMTLAEIRAQQALPGGDPNRLFAVGKYQIIPSTMRDAIAKLGLGVDRKLTNDLHEALFRNYLIAIKRPQVKSFITGGGSTLGDAQLALALEFASFADPHTGKSHYGGSGGNRASVTIAQAAVALNAEQATYQADLAADMTPDKAWNALSA
jgi:hypothetical protein